LHFLTMYQKAKLHLVVALCQTTGGDPGINEAASFI